MNSLLLLSDAWKYSIIAIIIVVAVVLIFLIIFFTRKSFKNNVVDEYEGDEEDDDDDEDRPDPVYEEEPDEDEDEEEKPAPVVAETPAPAAAEEEEMPEEPSQVELEATNPENYSYVAKPVSEEVLEELGIADEAPAKDKPPEKKQRTVVVDSALSARLSDYSYSYSFKAKLTMSTPEIHDRYHTVRNEIRAYKGIRIKDTWSAQTVTKGRETIAKMMFRGKTLCIALALDPKEYADTQYKGTDMSAKRAYAKIPMLLKLSSKRKVKYAVYLIDALMKKYEVGEKGAVPEDSYDIEPKTLEELIAEKLVKQRKNAVRPGDTVVVKETGTVSERDMAEEPSQVEMEAAHPEDYSYGPGDEDGKKK
ncbi:MAG: hypothetical protein LUD29_03455 [Clostridia bacterium]|nr:hypothetical protein [Clostridia bacterium]